MLYVYTILFYLMVLPIPVFSQNEKTTKHLDLLKELYEVRNRLLERNEEAMWLPSKRHKEFMKTFEEKGSSYVPFDWFDEESKSYSVNRFSIYGGHFFGFKEFCENKTILGRVSSLADKLKKSKLQVSNTLQLIELQFDFLEMLELLKAEDHSKTKHAKIHEKLEEDLQTIFFSLVIDKEGVKDLGKV